MSGLVGVGGLGRAVALAAMVAAAACSKPQGSGPRQGMRSSAAEPSGAEAAADAVGQGTGEELIEAYRKLARDDADAARLDGFISRHPAVLEARAEPYGSALMWVLERADEQAALALVRAGALANAGASDKEAALRLAARGGLDAVVTKLLAVGVSAGAAGYWGAPLHHAAKYGHASTLRLLLKAGADPNAHARDHDFTPLHLAVIDRRLEAVRVLIAAKADLEARDDDGRTPLHWGGHAYTPQPVHEYAELGQPHTTHFVDPGPADAMKLLLDAGADIDALDHRGNTALHAAVRVGSRRGVELLLARGARRRVKNKAGETPLSLAHKRNDPDIMALLKRRP